jgi:methylthioribose-1-phosphate isomerase
MIQALRWCDDHLELLDQTLLPERAVFLNLTSDAGVFEAIQSLRVRGAPAIGIAAAYGLHLGMRATPVSSRDAFFKALNRKVDHLASARPTAVNLSWALGELARQLETCDESEPARLTSRLLELAIQLHEDDRQRCDDIADHGQALVPDGARILTHCNAGALATGGIGTALGVVHRAHRDGKRIKVYADETRPVLQGARLTVWELAEAGIPGQLICDNMAAALMQQGGVDLVIVGADRIAADGSVANKIGTYCLAVLARHHGIPFHVAAPLSTFDPNLDSGRDIPIEHRNPDEIRTVLNQVPITVPGFNCWNPAFDVTPPELVTAIVTEKGILRPPFREAIAGMLRTERDAPV